MPRSHQIPPDRVTGADQVTQRLLLIAGNPDRVQLARQQQPHQMLGVPPIGLHAIPACARDPARRPDHAPRPPGCRAPRRSVFTRSPLARGILLGAATTHSTPRLASSRARPYPVGPASYATRTGRGRPAQNPAAPAASPSIENVCNCPVSASKTTATIFVACTSKPTRVLAFAMAGSSNMRLWAVARRLPRGMNFTPRTPWGSRPLLHRGPDGRSIHIV